MDARLDVDVREILKGLDRLDTRVQRGIRVGLARAGYQLMRDAIMQVPTVPFFKGWLRGSGSVFVDNELSTVSDIGDNRMANRQHTESKKSHEHVCIVGFNAPYAARLHEGNFHFKEPGAGRKFLEAKAIGNAGHYVKIIGNAIKEELRD